MSERDPTYVTCLWAIHGEGGAIQANTPQFVTAYAEGLEDAWPEAFEERRGEAEAWYMEAVDEPVVCFFTTHARIPRAGLPDPSETRLADL